MSLIHWWPLNGDTQDKITGKSGALKSGGVVDGAGKIGKCYSSNNNHTFTSATWSCADGIEVLNGSLVGEVGSEYSFACWFKVHGKHGQYQTCIMSSGDWNSGNCWVIGFDQNNTAIFCPVNNYNKGRLNLSSALSSDQWYHLATVYKNGVSTAYLNGTKVGEVSAQGIYQSSSTTAYIGRDQAHSGFFPYNGDINDLRIYDHALSQAEIKELSKALVIHYTFDDICTEPTTNIITGIKSASGKASLESGRVKINWSPSGDDSYFFFNWNQTIKANSIYTLSFDCEGLKSGEVATFALSNLSASSYNIALKNGRNSLTFTAGSDLMNDINTYNRLFFDDKTRTNGAIFYLSNFQLEEKDHTTPYTPTSRNSFLHNETGLIQPNTLNNVNLTTDSKSGTLALKCQGSTQIICTNMSDATQGVTASFWVKCSIPSDSRLVFADNNSKIAFGFFNNGQAIITCGGYGHAHVSNIRTNWSAEWNHIIVRKTSSNIVDCYINGVKQTLSGSQEWTHSSTNSLSIGCRYSGGWTSYFTGLIDDFRYYNTYLSDNDILDLYKTKAYVTDKGDMETHQFIEGCAELQITHNGCVETRDVQEIGNAEYEQLEYIASTGTQYIDTGVYWTSEKATIVADLMVTTWKASSTIFGSEERYSGSNRYFAHILHAGSANGNYANYIGTTSHGTTTTLVKDTRYVLEYIAHGNNTFSTKTTNHNTGEVKVYNNKVAYAGTILTRQNSTQTAANKGHIYIFSNHNAYNGTAGIQNMAAMKLYRFSMIQDDIYVRDFIPCRRKSDGKVGLFDLVTGQFYTSPAGNFTAGNVVTNEDMQVKFISGGTIQARQIIEL